MRAAKRDWNASPNRDFNIWLWALEWAWQSFFLGQPIGVDETNTLKLTFGF